MIRTIRSTAEFPDLVKDGRVPELQEVDERIAILTAAAVISSERSFDLLCEAEHVAALALDFAFLASKLAAHAERWARESERYSRERAQVETERTEQASDPSVDEAAE
jgi:hypothetical protein